MKHRGVVLAFSAVVLAQVVALAGCATNPVTGRRELSLVSSQQELQIGRDGYQAMVQEYGAYDQARLAAYVDSVGQKLAAVSHMPNLAWHFTLLDDPVVNAFAMPGGYVYITRGILAHLNSEAQLAGVLGHEIGHVTARHTAQRITQQQIAGLGLGLASMFSQGFQRYSGAAEQALGLLFLKYGRDDETQADELGVEYAVRAGYDPREIPATYVMLRRTSEQSGQRLPTFLSTHPDPGDREVRTRELARAAAAGKTGLIVKNRDYVRRLDGVVYGNDPRQGYFEGTRFVHPELAFEITFPGGWKTQNTRTAVLASAPDETGAMQLTLADAKGSSPEAYVAELQRSGRIAGAAGGRETIGGFAAWVGELGVAQSDGSRATMFAAFIRRSDQQFFQILGRSGAGPSALAAAARTFRAVDPKQVAATPARVRIATVAASGTFESVVTGLGPQAIGIGPTAILNNAEPDDPAARGTLIKFVPKAAP
jgi:predicted Zn-dependent protease